MKHHKASTFGYTVAGAQAHVVVGTKPLRGVHRTRLTGHDQRSCWSMTPLREKFIRGLAIRGRADRTQQAYTAFVADLARYYHRSPDQISYEEVTVLDSSPHPRAQAGSFQRQHRQQPPPTRRGARPHAPGSCRLTPTQTQAGSAAEAPGQVLSALRQHRPALDRFHRRPRTHSSHQDQDSLDLGFVMNRLLPLVQGSGRGRRKTALAAVRTFTVSVGPWRPTEAF